MEEIKEKIEITEEIFNNVVEMMKSSNEEDFFIALNSWQCLKPSLLLNIFLYKFLDIKSRVRFNDHMTNNTANRIRDWVYLREDIYNSKGQLLPTVWDHMNHMHTTELEKSLYERICKETIDCSLELLDIKPIIKSYDIKLNWSQTK
jgi:hypothetical protein